MIRATLVALFSITCVALFPRPVLADTAPELSGSGWVNAGDLSLERLRGKVVVLYFYEEG